MTDISTDLRFPQLGQLTWRWRGMDIVIGALAVLGHAPFHIWPAMVLMLVYMALRLDALSQRDDINRAKSGFWAAGRIGFGCFLVGMFWVGAAFIARGPEYIPLMPPMVLGLVSLLALFWALAGRFFVYWQLRGVWSVIGFSALFFLAEYARGHVLTGLPWNLPGYVFKAGGPISQSASVFGIYGLTWLVFIVGALLAFSIQGRRFKAVPLVSSLVILGGLWGGGAYRLQSATLTYVPDVRLRLVQVPFQQSEKFDADRSIDIVNAFIRASVEPSQVGQDPTHIIWPEGAVNGLAIDNAQLLSAMGQSLAYRYNTPPIWLFNSLRQEQRRHASGRILDDYYNSSVAVSFDQQGLPQVETINDKTKLVPFGEFVPGGKWVEGLGIESLSTAMASISPATEKQSSDIPGLPRVSPQLCFEIIFSGLTPRPKNEAGAEWILNQSNDAWYGASIGPHQHANIARYRAIEEGLPVIRAASNGWTGSIDHFGRFIEALAPTQAGILDIYLPNSHPTAFKHGINLILFLINMSLSLLCLIVGRSR